MKIAYITIGNPYDKHSWSGTDYYVRKALEQQGHSVYCIYGYKKITLKMILYIPQELVPAAHFPYGL